MLKKSNPYNESLSGLRAFMIFQGHCSIEDLGGRLAAELRQRRGRFRPIGENKTLFEIDHKNIDGMGLVRLHRLLRHHIKPPFRPDSTPIYEPDLFGQYGVWHFSIAPSSPVSLKTTLTLAFINGLADAFPRLREENVGLVTNLENEEEEKLGEIWGNAIAVIAVKPKEIVEFSSKSKTDWKTFVVGRAIRTMAILKRRKISDESFQSIVISSIGNVTSELAPENMAIGPLLGSTPTKPETLNIFLWKHHDRQHLLLCGDKDHWMLKHLELIQSAWTKLFIKT